MPPAFTTWGLTREEVERRPMTPREERYYADGVAAEHAPQARVEAARKMYRNHEVLLKDLTRADGPPVSQPGLVRLPGREKDVELFLREVARRLGVQMARLREGEDCDRVHTNEPRVAPDCARWLVRARCCAPERLSAAFC